MQSMFLCNRWPGIARAYYAIERSAIKTGWFSDLVIRGSASVEWTQNLQLT